MPRRSSLRRATSGWWHKWTVERPGAFGDWLWMVFVVQFADFLNRLTFRRVLEIIAITVLVLAFIQTLPIDLAVLFAGDTLMYLEIVTLTSVVTANLRVRALLHSLARSSKNAWNVTANVICGIALRVRTARQRRTKTRVATARTKGPNNDPPVVGWVSATAFA
jgi:hypothetical protein